MDAKEKLEVVDYLQRSMMYQCIDPPGWPIGKVEECVVQVPMPEKPELKWASDYPNGR